MSVPRTEIPVELLDTLLIQARWARRMVQPGVSVHNGTDVAELAEDWATRLHMVKIGDDEPLLTQADMDELTVVVREAAESWGVENTDLDPDFVTSTESALAFLRHGD